MGDAFWLPPVREALVAPVAPPLRRSNRARPGDLDYGKPGPKPPKAKTSSSGSQNTAFDAKHRRAPAGAAGGGRFIQMGSSGQEVQAVKRGLGVQNSSPQFGYNLKASVEAFQRKHGLVVDGIVGHQTALALVGRPRAARAAKIGALTAGDRALILQRHQPKGGRSGSARSRRSSRAARGSGGSLYGPGLSRSSGGVVVEAAWQEALHPRDTLGKFAEKIGAAFHSPHAVVPQYDASKLKFGKPAGGSNGARWAFDKSGQRWLIKTYGGNEDRVATELLSNAVYRELGARVPRAGRIRLHNGKQALSYPALEGKPIKHVFQRRGARPSAEVGEHFMTDALLANWDVAGLEDDNILWDSQGKPFRVDQGGTLEYRAQGKKKDFGPVPLEVTTMLLPGGQGRRSSAVTLEGLRAQAHKIAETLTPGRIDALVAAAGFKDKAMRDRVRRNLRLRTYWMAGFAAGRVGLPEPPGQVKEAGDAFWLAEAALGYLEGSGAWSPHLHPRDAYGKFIDTIGSIGSAFKGVKLDSKTTVTKDKDGTFRVVRSGGIIKGFKDPGDAARAALDRSLKGKESDSVGGNVSYKHFDDFLAKQGVNPEAQGHFGGKKLGLIGLEQEAVRLGTALDAAQASQDKYVQRQVPTLKARRDNALAKIKKMKESGASQAKPIKGPQPNPMKLAISAAGEHKQIGVPLHNLDIAPGDVIQYKKGGWKYTVTEVKPSGGVKAQAANGATKNFSGYKAPAFVTKADGSELKLKDMDTAAAAANAATSTGKPVKATDLGIGAKYKIKSPNGVDMGTYEVYGETPTDWLTKQAGTQDPVNVTNGGMLSKKSGFGEMPTGWTTELLKPGAASAPVLSVAQIKDKLVEPGFITAVTIGGLPDGAVIQTPDGTVGIMKPSEPAFQGYSSAYNIETGTKFEPPSGKAPTKYSIDPGVKKAAAEHLKKVNTDATVTTADSAIPSQSGPPPVFDGVPSWHAAEQHLPVPGEDVTLTAEERAAIKNYTSNGYVPINEYLRASSKVGQDLGIAKKAAAIKRALSRSVVKHDLVIGRKTKNADWKANAKAGLPINDNGVLSTSVDPNAWSGDIHLNILVKKGQNALFVKSISSHPGEQEVLLPPGSQFEVLKREDKGGAVVLWVKML